MSDIAQEKFALDSCMISFAMKDNLVVKQHLNKAKQSGHAIEIPPVAYYEVKRGLMAINATRRLRIFAKMCEKYPVGQMDNSILEEAASIYTELKPQGINIDDNDLFIAAYCKVHGLTLVTNNTKHFGAVSGLSLADWSV
ncbi:MAG: PIN domain-containing protein [Treponema sp.]|jgi:predicted nucleic acid-binding protein|nr:PIN domain-containing protein [Treponema sp.]